ncbi:hypothetical protein M2277_000768 [Paenibacillus sp. LBL]|uniref:hypothetical protein n=1 Tax=Paenibacillus sp. LBL TaxID=2940563 RepID=UPI002476EE79|nr:hypothetical protein [Paenibacillus sp. LBL]MDH6670124.1 hypothetical protein [Paenibacillus sp. LBL]
MVVKRGLPEDMTILLRQLVINGHFRMASTVLFVFFKRNWSLEDDLAAYYVVRYFLKYYPDRLEKHQKGKRQAR